MLYIIIGIAVGLVVVAIVNKRKASEKNDYDDGTKEYYASKEAVPHYYDDQQLESELIGLIREGMKIKAIKKYREATGADLKTAKEYIEKLGRNIC